MPSRWASYLINNDSSSLTSEEVEEINQFLLDHKIKDIFDVSDEVDFQRFNGLGYEVADYTCLMSED